MPKKMDDIIDEIHANAVEDRAALSQVREKIVESFDPGDQFARAATADSVSRLSDSMSRINAQLLEIAKIKLKEHIAVLRAGEEDGDDPDSMFDEIGEGFAREEVDNN